MGRMPELTSDRDAVRGLYLCLNQLTHEARSLGLKFAVAHMNVALLEIADVLDDPSPVREATDLELQFANDADAVIPPAEERSKGSG